MIHIVSKFLQAKRTARKEEAQQRAAKLKAVRAFSKRHIPEVQFQSQTISISTSQTVLLTLRWEYSSMQSKQPTLGMTALKHRTCQHAYPLQNTLVTYDQHVLLDDCCPMQSVSPGNQRIVIDLDFEGMMPEGDQRHLIQQLSYSYHANSCVDKPCHLNLLGLHGQLAKLTDQLLPSIANWHITRSEKKWHEHFADEKDKVSVAGRNGVHVKGCIDSLSSMHGIRHEGIFAQPVVA